MEGGIWQRLPFYRFLVLIVGELCLIAISSNQQVINFAFICMTEEESNGGGNQTLTETYDYSPAEKSYIIWAVAAGTILGTLPANYAYVTFGARLPFLVAGLMSAISTALIPWAAAIGMPALLFFRFIQGLSYAADFAAVGVLCVRWAPLAEAGIFLAVLTSFSALSSTLTNTLTGSLCTSSLGWKWAFYIHSLYTVAVFLLWIIVYSDDPHLHGSVSAKELKIIQKDKTKEHIEREPFVPYWEIVKSPVILVIWLNAFTELTTGVGMSTYAPIYFKKALGYSIGETAFLASFASLCHFPAKLFFAICSDKITCVSEWLKMRFFNTLAIGLGGLLCVYLGLASAAMSAVAAVTLFNIFSSANASGFYKCGTMHARQFAHFVLAMVQFSKCAALFTGPALTALFLHDDGDRHGWMLVFVTEGIAMIIASLLFLYLATDQPAAFTRITRQSQKKEPENGGIALQTS